jgi:hypothetical protein
MYIHKYVVHSGESNNHIFRDLRSDASKQDSTLVHASCLAEFTIAAMPQSLDV